jgi:hypothetical protein
MKSFLALSLLVFSTLTFADSAKFKVGAFKGELQIQGDDIKVKSLTLVARLQHCNFFGTTCAGGPSEVKSSKLSFKKDTATNLITFVNPSAIKLSTFKPVNRFSSCNLEIDVLGEKDGVQYEGYIKIIHKNDKEFCASEQFVANEIANVFKTPQAVKVWRKY